VTTPTSIDANGGNPATAKVQQVMGNIVVIETDIPMRKNEVAYVCVGDQRLKAESLRVQGITADLQVFEETQGVRVGDRVELTGQMLSVTLGPGLLGSVFDGLQSPLFKLAERDGYFLLRGKYIDPLDRNARWAFTPTRQVGERLRAGDTIGTVPEKRFTHKIMIPFDEPGEVELLSIREGELTLEQAVARIRDDRGQERDLPLLRHWPVRIPLPERLIRRRLSERQYPSQLLSTTQRIIDTFFPIALGGTACIPGPFGAGKTILQGLIARYSSADIVIQIACGERAGEVVETIHDFSKMQDPRTGTPLMDRTVIICNTSSMPVAAREASLFTGITLGEYYRQMGYHVLLIADSTSRWAQAMRETSGRLEEIPGEEAYPAYLDSSIKGIYERAGLLRSNDGSLGSLTMIGTVSPAGGNFEEPVTQSTLGAVKTFLGLSYDRAYKRYYPAIDPLISWSRYLKQLQPHLEENLEPGWVEAVARMEKLLQDGDAVHKMMQVTGEEGITLEDYITYEKSVFLDMVYLQQDAFDPVDVAMPLERQKESFRLVRQLIDRGYNFPSKEQVRDFFTRLTGLYKNLNYSARDSADHADYLRKIEELARAFT
jgi:V/A-type H+-transporting ATPase subunit A